MLMSDRIGRRLKLQDLNVFIAVVQAGSMRKAAERLNTVQPAISRSIGELERAFGVRLLDRRRQGIEPTEYGRALLACGLAVFDDLRQGVKTIESLVDPTVGEVRVGCNATLAASFVSVVVDRLARRYPRIVFRVVTAYVETLYRELAERSVDLLIARRSGSIADERLNFEFLFGDSFSFVVGARNPLARRRRIELAELANEPWVLPAPPERVIESAAKEAFRASGLDYPRTTVFTASPELRMSLLATGRFVSIVPDCILRFSARSLELKALHVKQSLSSMPVGIVTLKNRTLSPVAQLFIDSAREVAKPLAKTK